jgi:hypothetical protein
MPPKPDPTAKETPTDRQLLHIVGRVISDARPHKLRRIEEVLKAAGIAGPKGPYTAAKLTDWGRGNQKYFRNYRKNLVALGLCEYCKKKNTTRPGKPGCRACLDLRKAIYAPNLSRHSDKE